jgi:hypothetical protein
MKRVLKMVARVLERWSALLLRLAGSAASDSRGDSRSSVLRSAPGDWLRRVRRDPPADWLERIRRGRPRWLSSERATLESSEAAAGTDRHFARTAEAAQIGSAHPEVPQRARSGREKFRGFLARRRQAPAESSTAHIAEASLAQGTDDAAVGVPELTRLPALSPPMERTTRLRSTVSGQAKVIQAAGTRRVEPTSLRVPIAGTSDGNRGAGSSGHRFPTLPARAQFERPPAGLPRVRGKPAVVPPLSRTPSDRKDVLEWVEVTDDFWPALPALPEPRPDDWSAMWRAWQRRERLDQEQRGDGWSE